MILIPHGKKIALIATSLFITTFSLVFFVAGGVGEQKDMQANVFADFFHPGGQFESYMEKAEPVAALDLSGTVIEVNEKFSETLGYGRKDIITKNFFSLLSVEDLPAFASDFSGTSTSGKILVNAGPFHIMTNDGNEHVVLATLDLIKKEEGTEKMVVITIKDITESIDKDKKPSSGASQGKTIKELDTAKPDENRIIVEKTV